jgi:hypothetical protein
MNRYRPPSHVVVILITYYVYYVFVFGRAFEHKTQGGGLEMYREDLNKLAGLDARIKASGSFSILPRLTGNHIGAAAGFALAILLLIPATWLPGLLLFIIPSEVYLLDWTYSKLSSSNETDSDISKKRKGDYSKIDRGKTLSSWNIFSQFAR